MDLQQIVALTIVAAAAAMLAVRLLRRRKRHAHPGCADCVHRPGEHDR